MILSDSLNQFINSISQYFLSDLEKIIKVVGPIGTMIIAALSLSTFILMQIWPRWRAYLDSRSLIKAIGAELCSPVEIRRSLDYYIEPLCQIVDPSGEEEPRALIGLTKEFFKTLDEILNEPSINRYTFLLADSGMGKTSALINYYARHKRMWGRKKYKVQFIPLGIPNADVHIAATSHKRDTVLFLDAFDEDTLAIHNHAERIKFLMNNTFEFRAVVISCRTQFFSKDEEIPTEVGILKVGPRPAGESGAYSFRKLYLSPFKPKQAIAYLKRRYPWWKVRERKRRSDALAMASKIPHLAARPMLLAHIDVLVRNIRHVHINYAFELYEEMVNAWLERERGFVNDPEQLRKFSERLAVELYKNRGERGAEHVPRSELTILARNWGIVIEDQKLSDWTFSTRSLLNRDVAGNYKFAHRSILEYFFAKSFVDGVSQPLNVTWTDQMHAFLWEMLEKHVVSKSRLPFNDSESKLSSMRLGRSEMSFLTETAATGLSLIRSQAISGSRCITILKTATAICGWILDPEGINKIMLTLIAARVKPWTVPVLSPLVIYFDGQILDINLTEGLSKYNFANHTRLFASHIPGVDESGYIDALRRMKRIDDLKGQYSVGMPLKLKGEYVGVMVAESDHKDAFKEDRHVLLHNLLIHMTEALAVYKK